jgi:hypothetical protein
VDGFDDLAGVDAVQVDGGHAEVLVAELALDDVQRTDDRQRDLAHPRAKRDRERAGVGGIFRFGDESSSGHLGNAEARMQ